LANSILELWAAAPRLFNFLNAPPPNANSRWSAPLNYQSGIDPAHLFGRVLRHERGALEIFISQLGTRTSKKNFCGKLRLSRGENSKSLKTLSSSENIFKRGEKMSPKSFSKL
jgi:hypothetical protein